MPVFRKGIEAAGKGAASVVDGWAGMPVESWQAARSESSGCSPRRKAGSSSRVPARSVVTPPAESAVKTSPLPHRAILGISVPEQGVVTAVRTRTGRPAREAHGTTRA